jgi:hypothetical protein
MAIYLEDQTEEWIKEFIETFGKQRDYADEIPEDLWNKLDKTAKRRKDN